MPINIPVEMGQYHDCWCLGSLHRQAISNHDNGYALHVFLSSSTKDHNYSHRSQSCEMTENEYNLMFCKMNSAFQGLSYVELYRLEYTEIIIVKWLHIYRHKTLAYNGFHNIH